MILSGREVFCDIWGNGDVAETATLFEVPSDQDHLVVGQQPVLGTEDADGSYLRVIAHDDRVLGSDGHTLTGYFSPFRYLALRLNRCALTAQQFAGMTVRVSYRGLPPMFDPPQYLDPTFEVNELWIFADLLSFDSDCYAVPGMRATEGVAARADRWGYFASSMSEGDPDMMETGRAKLAAGDLGMVISIYSERWRQWATTYTVPMANILDVSSIVVTVPASTLDATRGPLSVNFAHR